MSLACFEPKIFILLNLSLKKVIQKFIFLPSSPNFSSGYATGCRNTNKEKI